MFVLFAGPSSLDASEMVDVILQRGAEAKTKKDILTMLSFISNMGSYGKYDQNTEDFLIDCLTDSNFRRLVWPILDDLKETLLFVDDAVVNVVSVKYYKGPDGTDSYTVVESDRKKIYIRHDKQNWDEVQDMIKKEAGSSAEMREVNTTEYNIKESAIISLLRRSSFRGLDTLRSIAQDENEDVKIRESIEYQLRKTMEYGTYKKFLVALYSGVTE